MIRHIVEFRLSATDAAQRSADTQGIHDRLTALIGVVPGLDRLTFAPDLGHVDTHWDVVLVSEHPSNADLEAYQAHPSHAAAAAWISTVVLDRAIVDYEL